MPLKTKLLASCRYDGFLDNAIPKCYYADGYLVALDNLKAKGYSMLDRRISHGLHEAKYELL